MDKNGIDGLLPFVSDDLRMRYQAKNLDGKTLKEVNAEYKVVAQQQMGMSLNDWFPLMMFALPAGMILAVYLRYKGIPTEISRPMMVVFFVPIFLYFFFVVRVKHSKDRETRYRCEPILRDFRWAVEALNPLVVLKKGFVYTGDSVWGTLLLLNTKVLEAKQKFIDACRAENPMIEDVQKAVEWEQDCRRRFNEVFEASEKFGLDFSKPRIYSSAQDEIDSRS